MDKGDKSARGEARLLKKKAQATSATQRSHLEWVCEASTKWRNDGCNEAWTIQGKGKMTALGQLLYHPQIFAPDSYDAAMDVLITVSISGIHKSCLYEPMST